MCVCVCAHVNHSHVRLFATPWASLPGSSVHVGLSEAQILAWVATPPPRPPSTFSFYCSVLFHRQASACAAERLLVNDITDSCPLMWRETVRPCSSGLAHPSLMNSTSKFPIIILKFSLNLNNTNPHPPDISSTQLTHSYGYQPSLLAWVSHKVEHSAKIGKILGKLWQFDRRVSFVFFIKNENLSDIFWDFIFSPAIKLTFVSPIYW